MPLNHDIVGVPSEPAERSWTSSDVLLYALAVGAGQADPTAELGFTTENSMGVATRVLPTFANLLGRGGVGDRSGISTARRSSMPSRPLRSTDRCLLRALRAAYRALLA